MLSGTNLVDARLMQEEFREKISRDLPSACFLWFDTTEDAQIWFNQVTDIELSPAYVRKWHHTPAKEVWYCHLVLHNPSFSLLELEDPDLRAHLTERYLCAMKTILFDRREDEKADWGHEVIVFFAQVVNQYRQGLVFDFGMKCLGLSSKRGGPSRLLDKVRKYRKKHCRCAKCKQHGGYIDSPSELCAELDCPYLLPALIGANQ